MALSLSTANINGIALGANAIQKVSLGSLHVWPPQMTPWVDTFNRANSSNTLGSNWANMTNDAYMLEVNSNIAAANTAIGLGTSRYGYFGGVATNLGWPKSDNYKVSVALNTNWNLATDNWASIILGWDGSPTSSQLWIAFMGSTGSGSKIIFNHSANVNAATNNRIDYGAGVLATGGNITKTDTITFQKQRDTYTVFRNSAVFMTATWGGIPNDVNTSRRRPGLCAEANHPTLTYLSPCFDQFNVQDL